MSFDTEDPNQDQDQADSPPPEDNGDQSSDQQSSGGGQSPGQPRSSGSSRPTQKGSGKSDKSGSVSEKDKSGNKGSDKSGKHDASSESGSNKQGSTSPGGGKAEGTTPGKETPESSGPAGKISNALNYANLANKLKSGDVEGFTKEGAKMIVKSLMAKAAPYIIAGLLIFMIVMLIIIIAGGIVICASKVVSGNPITNIENLAKSLFTSVKCTDEELFNLERVQVKLNKTGPEAVPNPQGNQPEIKYVIKADVVGQADDIIVIDHIPPGTAFVNASGTYSLVKDPNGIVTQVKWSFKENGMSTGGSSIGGICSGGSAAEPSTEALKNVYGASPAEVEAKLVTINFQGKSIKVHQLVKNLFEKVNNEITAANTGYSFKEVGTYTWRPKNCPGGCSGLSTHSFGIAIDINPSTNPYTDAMTHDIPQAVADIFKQNGFFWGADWKTHDWMHFQFNGECKAQ